MKHAVLLAMLIAALTACASREPFPSEQLAVAEAAVARANTTATREHAAGELQTAISKLARAQAAASDGMHELARQLAEQAEVDAHVAELRSQAVRASVAAREAQEANRALLEEIRR